MSEVANGIDLAVGDEVCCAREIAQDSYTEVNILDSAGNIIDADNVTHTILVFRQDHKTREIVLDQTLGAKSYGEAEKAFTQGIQLDPADPWLLIHRATARDYLKDTKGAREDLMKALMIKDLDADAISEIRDMLSVLRDSEPARP